MHIWPLSPVYPVFSILGAFSIYKTNITITVIRSPRYFYPIVTFVTNKDPLQGEHAYCHRPLNRALIPTLSHPKSRMSPTRGKDTLMPLKPWPTSYLLKIRHDLAHSGRLPTCKQHKPQAVTYHTIYTQSILIINYIFIHIILKCIQRYRLSIKFTVWHMIQ